MKSLKMLPARRRVLLTTFLLLSQPSPVSPTCDDRQCSTHFLEKQWNLTSSNCVDISVSSLAICSIRCAADLDCLFFQATCGQSCTCRICKDITALNLAPTGIFYIRRRQFVHRISDDFIWMSGGLHAGHITEVMFSCDPLHLSQVKSYHFLFLVGTEQKSDTRSIPLRVDLNRQTDKTAVQIILPSRQTNAPRSIFTFHPSSELHVVIFVDPKKYNIFVNGALFNVLPHNFKDLSKIQYTLSIIYPRDSWKLVTLKHTF